MDLYKKEKERFLKELSDDENSRIIFSGPFGIGKTTFLKGLAEKVKDNSSATTGKFNYFHIYPVNYSVSANGDIFQYIKYDLIYSLINKGVRFHAGDFDFLKGLKKYLRSNAHKVAAKLFLFIPKVGKDLHEIFKQLDQLKEEIYKACETEVDEGEKFYEYLFDLENRPGSIYELDIYTKLIQKVLSRIKEQENTQNILIIDDLDRIDPHHIFRLLNVFSAHFDVEGGPGNKFGFDKIVFVCDLQNIRKIFGHLYGLNVDFNGYIDKFYSKSVFKFLNDTEIVSAIENRLAIKPRNEIDLGDRDKELIVQIVRSFLKNYQFNFRSALKADADNHLVKLDGLYKIKSSEFFSCRLLGVALFLRDLFGDYNAFLKVVDEMILFQDDKAGIPLTDDINLFYWYYDVYFTPVLHYRDHSWKQDQEFEVLPGNPSSRYKIKKRPGGAYTAEPVNATVYPNGLKAFWKNFKKSIEILHDENLV